jgi:4-nitrophenyl phosphatase
MTRADLATVRGFVFDLDGCVWNGTVLAPGALDLLTTLAARGRRLGFISNNSRATGDDLRRRLHGLGVTLAEHVLTPLEIIGQVITQRWGPSRVLVMGSEELAAAVVREGHRLVEFSRYAEATVVVVGNDFDLSYARLTVAARAVAAGAPLVTPNLDPRLPVEGGEFLPGCGAIVEAVAVAAGVRPLVVGKPDRPLFDIALRRMEVAPAESAMVGDSREADIRGGRAAGMRTVLYAPGGAASGTADFVVRSFAELAALAGVG